MCTACAPYTFEPATVLVSGGAKTACKLQSLECPGNSYYSLPANATADRTCTPCAPGTFTAGATPSNASTPTLGTCPSRVDGALFFSAQPAALAYQAQLPSPLNATAFPLFGAGLGLAAARQLLSITKAASTPLTTDPNDALLGSPIVVSLASTSAGGGAAPSLQTLAAAGFLLGLDADSAALAAYRASPGALPPSASFNGSALSISFPPGNITRAAGILLLCAVQVRLDDYLQLLRASFIFNFQVTLVDTDRTPYWPNSPQLAASALLPVAFAFGAMLNTVPSFAQPTASASVAEAALPGTMVLSIAVSADPWQSVAFAISPDAMVLQPLSAAAQGWPQPFALQPVFATSPPFFDPGNGAIRTRNVSNTARLIVALDALDFDAGLRSVSLVVSAFADGCFANAAAPCTPTGTPVNMSITVTVMDDSSDLPRISNISAPQSGLSTRGGDAIDIFGTSLGLVDAPPSQLNASIGAFALVGCKVIVRQTQLRCTTAPGGFGANLKLALSVSSMEAAAAAPISFMAPRVSVAGAADAAARLVAAGATASVDTILLDVDGVPAAALPLFSVNVTRGLAGDGALLPRMPMPLNCSALAGRSSPSLAPPDAGMQLLCVLPVGGGAGAGLNIVAQLSGRTVAPPTAGFSAPSIGAIWMNGPTSVVIAGSGLGLSQADLDFAQLSNCGAMSGAASRWPDGALARPPLPSDPCIVLLATGCAILAPSAFAALVATAPESMPAAATQGIRCGLDPRGWGAGFRARVSVGGTLSAWSADTVSYPFPNVTSITPNSSVATAGGTLLRILGSGFAGAGVTSVTVGGQPTNVSAFVLDPAGSGFIAGLLVSAPPGFGAVTVTVTVAGSSGSGTIAYEVPVLATLDSPVGSLLGNLPKSFKARGTGLSFCALCHTASPPTACVNISANVAACALPADPAAVALSRVTISGALCTVTALSTLDKDITVQTQAISGSLVFVAGGAASLPMANDTDYDLKRLQENLPTLDDLDLGIWPSAGNVSTTLTLKNAGAAGGTVTVTPKDAGADAAISCPIVWSSQCIITASATDKLNPPTCPSALSASVAILVFGGTTFALPSQLDEANRAVALAGAGELVSLASVLGVFEWRAQARLPCFVTLWANYGSTDVKAPNIIKFVVPAFVGDVEVNVVAGVSTANTANSPLQRSYEAPAITGIMVGGPDGSTANAVAASLQTLRTTGADSLILTGRGFGLSPSLALFGKLASSWWALGLPGGASDSPRAVNSATSTVQLVFSGGANLVPRTCSPIFSWSPTQIVCQAPVGAGGSANFVRVVINTTSTSSVVTSADVALRYAPPTLSMASPPSGPAVGGFSVTLSGANLANADVVFPWVTLPQAPSGSSIASASAAPTASAASMASATPSASAANSTGARRRLASARVLVTAPDDTAFFLSGTQAEGISSFLIVYSPAGVSFAAGPFGAANGSLVLANGSYLSAPGAIAPAALPSNGDVAWSAAAWIKCAAPSAPAAVLEWGAPGDAKGVATAGAASLVVSGGSLAPAMSNASATFQACDSTWHHIALTYSPLAAPSALSAFLDGALNASSNAVTIILPNAADSMLRVGWSGDLAANGGSLFVGALSQLRIYSRALTTAEVLALATPPLPPSTTPMLSPSHSPSPSTSTLPLPTMSPTPSASPLPSPSAPPFSVPTLVATGFEFWRVHVHFLGSNMSGAFGLVTGLPSGEIDRTALLSATDAAVTIVMPPFEGTVFLSVQFVSSDGSVSCPFSNTIAVTADAPTITSVTTTSVQDDPCRLLQNRSTGTQCQGPTGNLSAALTVYDWGNYSLPAGVTCFNARWSAYSTPVQLTIEGRSFGSGKSPSNSVEVISADGKRVPCNAAGPSLLVSGSESVVRCNMQGELVSGSVQVVLKIAFATATTAPAMAKAKAPTGAVSATAVFPFAVCPCGYFAVDGELCTECPDGASCAGAREPPRAMQGHWDRHFDTWIHLAPFEPLLDRSANTYWHDTRLYNIKGTDFKGAEYEVPQFPSCPVPDLCLPNLTCVTGAGGWTCSFCGTGYMRGQSGKCDLCKPANVRLVQMGVGAAAVFFLACALLLLAPRVRRCLRRHVLCCCRDPGALVLLSSAASTANIVNDAGENTPSFASRSGFMIAVRMSFADAAALDNTKTFAKDDGRELLRLLVIDAFTSYAAHLKLWLEKKTKEDKKEAQRTKEAKASCAWLCQRAKASWAWLCQRRGGAAPAAAGRECPGAMDQKGHPRQSSLYISSCTCDLEAEFRNVHIIVPLIGLLAAKMARPDGLRHFVLENVAEVESGDFEKKSFERFMTTKYVGERKEGVEGFSRATCPCFRPAAQRNLHVVRPKGGAAAAGSKTMADVLKDSKNLARFLGRFKADFLSLLAPDEARARVGVMTEEQLRSSLPEKSLRSGLPRDELAAMVLATTAENLIARPGDGRGSGGGRGGSSGGGRGGGGGGLQRTRRVLDSPMGRRVLQLVRNADEERVTLGAVAKLGLNFFQSVGAIASYANPLTSGGVESANLVGPLPDFLKNFRVFTDFGMSASTLQCAFASDYRSKVVGFMLMPFAGVFAALFLAPLLRRLKACRCLCGGSSPQAPTADAPPRDRCRPCRMCVRDSDHYAELILYYSLVVTMLVIPSSINTVAAAQNCADQGQGWFLFVDPEISCAEPSFQLLQSVAFYLGYLFLLVPVIVGSVLFFATRAQIKRARTEAVRKRVDALSDSMLHAELTKRFVSMSGLDGPKAIRNALLEDLLDAQSTSCCRGGLLDAPLEPDGVAPGTPPRQERDLLCCSADWAVSSLDFVHGEYRSTPMARAWEMVTLLRKSMLVGLSTGFLVLTSAPAQLVATMFLLSMGLVLHFVVIPFKRHSANLLEGLAMLGELASCFGIMTRIGVGSVTGKAGTRTGNVTEQEQLIFDYITIVLSCIFLFFWAVSLLDVLLFGGQLEFGLEHTFPELMVSTRAACTHVHTSARAHCATHSFASPAPAMVQVARRPWPRRRLR